MKRQPRSILRAEQLESRDAPATLVNATTLTYQDIDGDDVIVTVSKPVFVAATVNQVFTFSSGAGAVNGSNATKEQLQTVDLTRLATPKDAEGTNLAVAARRSPAHGGDGLANVGFIRADVDLGTVVVAGDLACIDAGTKPTVPAVQAIKADSMGRFGGVISVIRGALGSLTVTHDLVGAAVFVRGPGGIGAVTIGGSLVGGDGPNDGGEVFSFGDIGPVRIGGDVIGGANGGSGEIISGGKLAGVTIGGSLVAGSGGLSGVIECSSDMGPVKIGRDVRGGLVHSGLIESDSGRIASLTIGGSLLGGTGTDSGSVLAQGGDIGPVKIGHDIRGGSGDESGKIDAGGRLASLAVGGSVFGGSGNYATFTDNNQLVHAGQVFAVGDIGPVRVGGSVEAGSGQESAGIRTNNRLASLAIGGSLVGSDADGGHIVSGGDMGPVRIGCDVRAGEVLSEGALARVTIGGSLDGGDSQGGIVISARDMGPVVIGRDLRGGGSESGQLASGGNLARVTIGGSLIGGRVGQAGTIQVAGRAGPIRIAGDVVGGPGLFTGSVDVGSGAGISVGGSLVGGTGSESGEIVGHSSLGPVTIAHDVHGGSNDHSGSIESGGAIAGVSIGGSLLEEGAGSGTISGQTGLGPVTIAGDVTGSIRSDGGSIADVTIGRSLVGGPVNEGGSIEALAGDLGAVSVGGDVVGGAGHDSGFIFSKTGEIRSVAIGGSLVGGTGLSSTGGVWGALGLGPVTILGNLLGGSASGPGGVDESGFIRSEHHIASVTIGGSVISGSNTSSGTLSNSGAILAGDDIGSVVVRGSLVGNVSSTGKLTPVVVSARGQSTQGATTDLAIGKIRVRGRIEFANILAGYDLTGSPVNGDAQIGVVSVGRDWVASNLIVGVKDGNGDGFGNTDDRSISPGNVDITASIASVAIGGNVLGTPTDLSNTDRFGFEAQQIGALKVRGIAVPLHAGEGNDVLGLGLTGDVTVREVP